MKKFLTKEGLERLKGELEYLEKFRRKEVAEKMKDAIAQGDLSENASYEAAKEEQSFVEGKIRELRAIISQAEIIDGVHDDVVRPGSIVVLKSKDGIEEFKIVGPEEADILKGKISFQSPLGEALLNKTKGMKVEITTPGGKNSYSIEEVK